jgi:hypothetical protein
MHHVLRTLAYALLALLAYQCLVLLSVLAHAPLLAAALRLAGYAHGLLFSMGVGCGATSEPVLLALSVGVVVLVAWPTHLLALTLAVALGVGGGCLIRDLVRSHRS